MGLTPYYLTHKANELGYMSQVILAGRTINDDMANYVARKTVQHIIKINGNMKSARVLIKGATFKENVSDIRNSKVADVVNALKAYSVNVDVEDPHADSEELLHEYGFGLASRIGKEYDAVIITVPHAAYISLDDAYFCSITKPHALVADLKGIYRKKINNREYWSL